MKEAGLEKTQGGLRGKRLVFQKSIPLGEISPVLRGKIAVKGKPGRRIFLGIALGKSWKGKEKTQRKERNLR